MKFRKTKLEAVQQQANPQPKKSRKKLWAIIGVFIILIIIIASVASINNSSNKQSNISVHSGFISVSEINNIYSSSFIAENGSSSQLPTNGSVYSAGRSYINSVYASIQIEEIEYNTVANASNAYNNNSVMKKAVDMGNVITSGSYKGFSYVIINNLNTNIAFMHNGKWVVEIIFAYGAVDTNSEISVIQGQINAMES